MITYVTNDSQTLFHSNGVSITPWLHVVYVHSPRTIIQTQLQEYKSMIVTSSIALSFYQVQSDFLMHGI
jgi:hypothetical protein